MLALGLLDQGKRKRVEKLLQGSQPLVFFPLELSERSPGALGLSSPQGRERKQECTNMGPAPGHVLLVCVYL